MVYIESIYKVEVNYCNNSHNSEILPDPIAIFADKVVIATEK